MRKEETFSWIFTKNWDVITIGIVASICFQTMSYGKTILQKTLFAFFTAIILGLCISSFQWAEKQKRKNILFIVLILFWLISLFLIILFIPILVWITNFVKL
jgi:predicted PurR-regulated permease PerM